MQKKNVKCCNTFFSRSWKIGDWQTYGRRGLLNYGLSAVFFAGASWACIEQVFSVYKFCFHSRDHCWPHSTFSAWAGQVLPSSQLSPVLVSHVAESVSQAHCNWGKQHSFPEVCMGRPVFVLPKPSCLSCGITPMYFQSAFSLSVFEIESTFSYPDANHLITQRQFLVFPLRTIPPQQERRLNLDYIFS